MSRGPRLRLRRALTIAGLALLPPASAQTLIQAPAPRRLPPPSAALLRSLEGFQHDLDALDQTLIPGAAGAGRAETARKSALPPLPAPAATALPSTVQAVQIQRRLPLSLAEALQVAVQNDPDLAVAVQGVREQQGLVASARGRWWPELGLNLGGGFAQQRSYSSVWTDNAGLYPAGSPFLVQPQGWNLVQTNLGVAAARMELGWELISPGRSAAIAEADDSLRASRQRYADRLRQLQLDVSVAYYGLQLADQLQRIRKAVVDSDTVVRDQVAALKQVGLVPRLDLLRAEAALQQSRYRLEQAEALRLSRQRQLSNLINVPFDVTLTAIEAVRLQPVSYTHLTLPTNREV